jgi:hypothetical protein
MFSTIGYAVAAVVLALFAFSTIALDLQTVFRSERDRAPRVGPHLRLVGGSGPDNPRGGNDVSQSAA